jgi:GntR family transcriptional regulator
MTGTRAAALAQELRERIALADTGPGGALESEALLGGRYGVSRVTVRRALEELRAQGLVESRRGAGWFVTAASFHQTLALGTFRHAESAVSQAGKSATRRVVDFGYRAAPAAIAASLGLGDSAGDGEALYARSVRSVDGVPLDLSHEWVPGGLAASVSRADAEGAGIWATLQHRGHRIDVVRQSMTAALTTAADAALLGEPAGTPLLLVRRLALDPTGVPLALSDHRYLAHRFSLEVEFRGWSSAATAEPPGLRSTPDHISTVTEERQTAP